MNKKETTKGGLIINIKAQRNIKLLGLLNMFMDIKFYGAIAILYFVHITGSMALGMSIFAITMIAATIFEVPTGLLSDKVGRKKTVLLGTTASLIYAILFAISKNYMFLVLAGVFEGLERAFFSGNNEAMLYDTLKDDGKENEYKTYLGKTNSMYHLAGIISAIIGGVLLYFTSFVVVMWLSVIPKVISLFISSFLIEPKSSSGNIENNPYVHLKEALDVIKKDKTMKKQFFADSLSNGIGEAAYQFRAKFYEMVWPIWALGIPSLLSNVGSFIGNWYSGKIIKRYGNKKIIIFSGVYSICAETLGLVIKNVFSPIIFVTNSLLPTGVAKNVISNKLYTDKHRASLASIKSLVGSLIYAIAAIFVGLLADNIGVIKTLMFAQISKVLVVLVYNNIFKTRPELEK